MTAKAKGLSRRDVRTMLFAGDDNRPFLVNGQEVIQDPKSNLVTIGSPVEVKTSELRHGPLVVDPESRECSVDGRPVVLTRTEFDILHILMSKPKVVWERETVIENVWGPNWYGDIHVVEVHVSNIRYKLDPTDHLRFVVTCRGVGFQMSKM